MARLDNPKCEGTCNEWGTTRRLYARGPKAEGKRSAPYLAIGWYCPNDDWVRLDAALAVMHFHRNGKPVKEKRAAQPIRTAVLTGEWKHSHYCTGVSHEGGRSWSHDVPECYSAGRSRYHSGPEKECSSCDGSAPQLDIEAATPKPKKAKAKKAAKASRAGGIPTS